MNFDVSNLDDGTRLKLQRNMKILHFI